MISLVNKCKKNQCILNQITNHSKRNVYGIYLQKKEWNNHYFSQEIKAILLNFKDRPRNQIYDFRADFVQAPFKYFW